MPTCAHRDTAEKKTNKRLTVVVSAGRFLYYWDTKQKNLGTTCLPKLFFLLMRSWILQHRHKMDRTFTAWWMHPYLNVPIKKWTLMRPKSRSLVSVNLVSTRANVGQEKEEGSCRNDERSWSWSDEIMREDSVIPSHALGNAAWPYIRGLKLTMTVWLSSIEALPWVGGYI